MNLFIVINTCKQFNKIENIIKQFNNNEFLNKNVIIVSGQEDIDEIIHKDNIKIIKVRYTGIHLTGCIYISENMNLYTNVNYFLFLPDTIKFGSNFFKNIYKYYNKYLKENKLYSLGLIDPIIRQTMDMGFLHTKQILNMKEYLNKIKTFNVDKDNLLKLKKQLIKDENTILGCPNLHVGGTKHNGMILDVGLINRYKKKLKPNSQSLIQYISTEKKDIQEKIIKNGKMNLVYLPLLDLYKYQRSFRGLNDICLDLMEGENE